MFLFLIHLTNFHILFMLSRNFFTRFLWFLRKIFSINFFFRWLTCFHRCFVTFFKWEKTDVFMICCQRRRRRCVSTHASMHSLFHFDFKWRVILIFDTAIIIAWSMTVIKIIMTMSMLFLSVKISVLKSNWFNFFSLSLKAFFNFSCFIFF